MTGFGIQVETDQSIQEPEAPNQIKVSTEENIVDKVAQEQHSDDGIIKFDDGKKSKDDLPQSVKERYRKRDQKKQRKEMKQIEV